MRIGSWITAGAVTLGLATAAWALTGKNGWTATTVTTAVAIKANSTYVSGFGGTRWQDLAGYSVAVSGFRTLAADAAGNVYVVVRAGNGDVSSPSYTGLVRVSGSTITTLVQATMSGISSRNGTVLDHVVLSPSDTGGLRKGHPVVTRRAVSAGVPVDSDVVSVDPVSGAETLIYRFANGSVRVQAIDGSGTASNGTIYLDSYNAVDGSSSIVRLRYSGGVWVADTVPGGVGAMSSDVRVGPDGSLYCVQDMALSYVKDPIYRVNPTTGAASVWGYVDAYAWVQAWDVDASGTLWFGLGDSSPANKNQYYVTRGVAGGVTKSKDRIAEAPWSTGVQQGVTASAGTVYVAESVTIYALRQ